MRSDQPHKRQESGPGHSGLPLAENIKGLAMQNKCIISMHSQARATAFFAWGQMRLFFVSLTVINVIAPRQKNDTIFTLFLVGTHLPIVGTDLLNFPMINSQ